MGATSALPRYGQGSEGAGNSWNPRSAGAGAERSGAETNRQQLEAGDPNPGREINDDSTRFRQNSVLVLGGAREETAHGMLDTCSGVPDESPTVLLNLLLSTRNTFLE